jgi:hypothetical protein
MILVKSRRYFMLVILDGGQGHPPLLRLGWLYCSPVGNLVMAKPFPLHPKHPERICWGCDRYCATTDLACGNGADRTMHPAEMIGDDWYEHGDWGLTPEPPATDEPSAA